MISQFHKYKSRKRKNPASEAGNKSYEFYQVFTNLSVEIRRFKTDSQVSILERVSKLLIFRNEDLARIKDDKILHQIHT